jgi:hypothetical protein
VTATTATRPVAVDLEDRHENQDPTTLLAALYRPWWYQLHGPDPGPAKLMLRLLLAALVCVVYLLAALVFALT